VQKGNKGGSGKLKKTKKISTGKKKSHKTSRTLVVVKTLERGPAKGCCGGGTEEKGSEYGVPWKGGIFERIAAAETGGQQEKTKTGMEAFKGGKLERGGATKRPQAKKGSQT